jgi:hypothetical protein
MPLFTKNLFRAAMLALFFSSCVSSSIVSNKGDNLKGPFKKIYLVMHTDIHVQPFSRPLMENIRNEFAKRNIDLKTFVTVQQEKPSLSLDPVSDNDKINQEIREFDPEAVLYMVLTKIESTAGVQIGPPGSDGASFDIKLFQKDDHKAPVWRADFHVYGNSGISMAVGKGTRTLLAKLEEDNIIPK